MAAAPKLSVVIPCRNAAKTIGAQLQALLAQDCRDPWEVIVSDNGSTDDSVGVVTVLANQAPVPVRVVDAAHVRGAGQVRNVGVEQSAGSCLAFCDADDVVAPGWLQAACQALREYEFVGGRFDFTALNSDRVVRSRPPLQTTGLQRTDAALDLPHAGAGNMALHRDVFEQIGGFDPAMLVLEDTDLSWRLQQAGVPLAYASQMVVQVRLRSSWWQMYRQGRSYGVADAVLRQRYGVATEAASGSLSWRVGWRSWWGSPPSAGHLCWQVGWHAGFRTEG